MIAYKATYNYKCRNQTYVVGKTYTSDKLKICHYGMHYCNKMEDTLKYYETNKNFILLEVEILGDVETEEDKSVTNKLKVLRVVPFDEYTDLMKSKFPTYEYDSSGNKISATYPNGSKYTYEYDSSGNKISMTCENGSKVTYEYDDRGNKISETFPSGYKINFKYDDRGNTISATYPDGDKVTYEYDDRGNTISATTQNGRKYTYDVAIITEED